MKFNISKWLEAYKAGQINKSSTQKFFMIVGGITGAYLLLASIVTISLIASSNNQPRQQVPLPTVGIATPAPQPTAQQSIGPTEEDADDGSLLRPPAFTNVLLMGIDENALADVIMIASFHRDTSNIHLLSIPRDTFTQLPQHRIESMRANGLRPNSSGVMRLNALRPVGREYGVQYMQEHLSETLGIPFHFYVEVGISAFRDVVDVIGGVEIDVPRRMYYHDPYQNLLIDIPAGIQRLDGRMAEQFVRYRSGYANADIGRVNAQQQFMTQLFRQTLRRETIMNNPLGLAEILLRHVQTDARPLDMMRYVPYVANLAPDKIFTATLPGNPIKINGVDYWMPDAQQVPEVINRMFFGIEETEDENVTIPVISMSAPSKDANISVLNGTNMGGMATDVADRLHANGYTVVHVGAYSGEIQNRTRINVREEGLGEDLINLFANAVVIVDSNMSENFDIVIIVGRSEQ